MLMYKKGFKNRECEGVLGIATLNHILEIWPIALSIQVAVKLPDLFAN